MRRLQGLLPYLLRTLHLVYAAAPGLTLAWLALLALQGILPALSVLLTRPLVNATVAAIEAGGSWVDARLAVILALLLGLLLLVQQLLTAASNWVRTSLSEHVRDTISDLVHDRSLTLDLAVYDQPEYYDHLYRASQEASYRPIAILENLGAVVQNSLTLVAMAAILVQYGLWLPLVLLLSTLPALVLVIHNARRQHDFRRRTTADERRSWYYSWLLTTREAAAELRLFNLGSHFRTHFHDLRQRLRQARLELVRREGMTEAAAGLLALLAVGLTMLWMLGQTLAGDTTLGDLALVYQAMTQGQSLMRTLLRSMGEIYGNALFLGDLFTFLDLAPTVRDPEMPETPDDEYPEAVRFRDVSFDYRGATHPALHDFDLIVPAGKTVAIVGANGAGKTTFVKLLCRFYDPTDGNVELYGHDLRSLRQKDIRARLSVLFQTPLQYNASAADNILLADPDNSSLESARQAAVIAGADEVIERLPGGYQALLGIWFVDGTDLSVGEWRRIALARALLRKRAILVLDEPTSTMDPWAEAEWLGRFRIYAQGRTVILITHRFSAARTADLIYVVEDGTIAEQGSHEELVALGGKYARGWHEQLQARR